MKEQFPYQFVGSPLSKASSPLSDHHSFSLSESSPTSCAASPSFNTNEEEGDSKTCSKNSSIAHRIHEHVKLGGKVRETVKGKMRLGARIIKEGGRENIFKQTFGLKEGEELLKASQCYLSTTAGPIAGLLFISTHKLAFSSDKPLVFPSLNNGDSLKAPYKVMIPIQKIEKANQSENVNKPASKYIEIVTEDNYEFWFMGFLRYEKAFMKLQKAIAKSKGQISTEPLRNSVKLRHKSEAIHNS